LVIKKIILLIILGFSLSKEYIAVIDFEANNIRKSDARALTQRLTTELIKVDEYIVVERSQVDKMLKEQKFQHSGCVNITCAVEVGNMLGAKYIVVGTISLFGQTYTLDARLVDVESSESIRSADYTSSARIDELLVKGVPSIVRQLVGEYDESIESELSDNQDSDLENGIDWKSNNFLHYYRIGFDMQGDYLQDLSTVESSNLFEDTPDVGLTLGYEYAQINGIGLGLEYQFYRSVSDTDFGYNSFYLIYNFTLPETGLSLFVKGGISSLSIYEDAEVVNNDWNYDTGTYAGIGLRYPISASMLLEIGTNSNEITENGFVATTLYSIQHQYNRFYIGLSFIIR